LSHFQQVSRENRYRVIWSGQGPGGSGKTHFGYTAPGPIAHILSDPAGYEGVCRRPEFREKDIRIAEIKFNPGKLIVRDGDRKVDLKKTGELRAEAAKAALELFEEVYAEALTWARSILWDKEDHVWELLRYAKLDAVSGKPASYYELNQQYRAWIQDAADNGVNLGLIRGLKEVWGTKINPRTGAEQPVSTGEYEARGMKEVPELVQIGLDHWLVPSSTDAEGSLVPTQFMCRVMEKCRINGELCGQTFSNLDFETLAAFLYPESSPEDWQ
jgi:hypothetical protein